MTDKITQVWFLEQLDVWSDTRNDWRRDPYEECKVASRRVSGGGEVVMHLEIVHGDIETAEETEALQAISNALSADMVLHGPLTIQGTNDTTTFMTSAVEPPEAVVKLVEVMRARYPWWKMRIS